MTDANSLLVILFYVHIRHFTSMATNDKLKLDATEQIIS